MKALLIVSRGLENVAKNEILELTGAQANAHDGYLIAEFERYEQFFDLAYLSQTLTRVVLLLSHFDYKTPAEVEPALKSAISSLELSPWIDESYCVECHNENKEEFTSTDLARVAGGVIKDETGKTVDFKNPKSKFYLHLTRSTCLFGADLCGFDLSKRDYRIFIGSDTLKGPTAYTLLRLAGYQRGNDMLDPFCRSGTTVIEAALWNSNAPVRRFEKDKFLFPNIPSFKTFDFERYFDSKDEGALQKPEGRIFAMDSTFNDVVAAKKNAKIAGVLKALSFSKKELDWLDTKLGKHSIDVIATKPPQSGRRHSPKRVELTYKELCYQAEYILKEQGRLACLIQKEGDIESLKKHAKQYHLALTGEHNVQQGEESWRIIVFTKNPQA